MKKPAFTQKKHTLQRKLYVYMFALVALLLLLFFIGTFLIGGYSGTKRQLSETLEFQSQVFERQVSTHYSNLAVMGIQLSERTTQELETYLKKKPAGVFGAERQSDPHCRLAGCPP